MSEQEREREQGPTIRDKRRVDPDTGEVREAAQDAALSPDQVLAADESGEESAEVSSEVTQLKTALAERTNDLQRLQAEYVNYKRRVDRDRDLVRAAGVESVLRDLLSVLDDLGSAREHEELTGGFKAVAEEVERVAAKYGLEAYGVEGDPFDPHIHEALMHAHADDLTGPTCVTILQRGYRIKDRVLRPARVAVAEPAHDQDRPTGDEAAGQPPAESAASDAE